MDKTDLLKKYFHGHCTLQEKKYLFKHLQPEDIENYQEVIEDLWNEFKEFPKLESAVSERMYQNILAKRNVLPVSKEVEKIELKQKSFYSFHRLAAVFAGLLFLTAVSLFLFHRYNQVEFSTAYGEKEVVVLPDSSVVTLNSNSSLTYTKGQFSGKIREVRISGEAYFDVRKRLVGNQRSKFIVHTDDVSVEVLGTRFNVNSRRETTEVVLESGKVRLSVADDVKKDILMQPGDLVVYSGKDRKLKHKIVLPEDYSKWRNNKLVFNGVSIEQIAAEIEDHFGYRVVLEDSTLKSELYRGTFPTDNIDVFLNSLSKSFDLEVVKKKGEIILR